jgi:hypothetical protein
MELEILDIKKENLEELLPELMSLEHNWTELGEASWTADNFRMELPKKWEFSFYAAQEGKMVGYVMALQQYSGMNS